MALLAKIRLYPFSRRTDAPTTKVIPLGGGESFANMPRGFHFWIGGATYIKEC